MNHISKSRQLEFIQDIVDSNVSDSEARILISALISDDPAAQMPSTNFDLLTKRSRLLKLQILHVNVVSKFGGDI